MRHTVDISEWRGGRPAVEDGWKAPDEATPDDTRRPRQGRNQGPSAAVAPGRPPDTCDAHREQHSDERRENPIVEQEA
jgi:hypothetical protein